MHLTKKKEKKRESEREEVHKKTNGFSTFCVFVEISKHNDIERKFKFKFPADILVHRRQILFPVVAKNKYIYFDYGNFQKLMVPEKKYENRK